jgi:hypothetical protein
MIDIMEQGCRDCLQVSNGDAAERDTRRSSCMRLACRPCSRPYLDLVTVAYTILTFVCQNGHSIIPPVPGGCLSRRMSIKSMLLPASDFAPDERLRSDVKAILGKSSTLKPLHGLHRMRGNISLGVVECKRTDDPGLARGTFGATKGDDVADLTPKSCSSPNPTCPSIVSRKDECTTCRSAMGAVQVGLKKIACILWL